MENAPPTTEAELAAHHAWLVRLAQRLARDEAEAQDLAQDAWAILLRRGPDAARDLRAFLAGIVRVRARRQRAEVAARRTREVRAARPEALPGPDVLLERLELSRSIADELRALPEAQRTLLLLRHQEGLSPARIGRRLHIPASTIRARLTRARDELRARLDRRHGGRRDAWAVIACTPLARESAPLGALAGALAVSTGMKWSLATLAALALGWIGWSTSDRRGIERDLVVGLSAEGALPAAHEPPRDVPPSANELAERTAVALPSEPASAPVEPARKPLTVAVTDARTGEPLPHYTLEVLPGTEGDDDTQETTLTTDEHGVATIASELLARPFTLRALDDTEDHVDSPLVRRVELDELRSLGDVLLLSVVAGPTYALELPPGAPDLGDLAAHVARTSELDSRGARVRPPPSGGARPWVRFDPVYTGSWLGTEGPWTLTVRDSGGQWLARGTTHQIVGRVAQPVSLEAVACGALHVTVTVDGQPSTRELAVMLAPIVEGAPDWSNQRHASLRPRGTPRYYGPTDGVARFEHLLAGAYRLSVGAQDLGFHPHDAAVRAGDVTQLAIDLVGRADLAPLVVIVRSQRGKALSLSPTLTAHREGEPLARHAKFSREIDAGAVEYRFDPLPKGEWSVLLEAAPHLPPWRETRQRAVAGGAPIEFVCLDADAPPDRLGFVRVIDARTQQPLPFAGVQVYAAEQGIYLDLTGQDGLAQVGPLPEGARVHLMTRAEGYRGCLVELDWTGFEKGEALEIGLTPGWGTRIDAVEPNPPWVRGKPLHGVRVLVDDREYGVTDEHGHLLIELDAPPRSVRFAKEGYHLQHSTFDPLTGAPDAQATYPHWVVLERD
jgi:RNA polymerase sigma factor (sigma-70 family)